MTTVSHNYDWEEHHRSIKWFLVHHYPLPVERDEMAAKLGIPRTTIHDHLKLLLRDGWVEKTFQHASHRGRPKTLWAWRRDQ